MSGPVAVREPRSLLVTGGAGFVGSAFVRYVLGQPDFRGTLVNLDLLTYAGNLENVAAVANDARYQFVRGDIADGELVGRLVREHAVDTIVHFAAESHVDRSIVARAAKSVHFHHVSTDEVFGSLGPTGAFREDTPYRPNSPYSASKAASDHLVRAYAHTYALPITLSNCSNNYGPYQFPEKLIPLMIMNLVEDKPLPIYGDGLNVRDWLYVDDHAEAVWRIVRSGRAGETYNVGGEGERTNLEIVRLLIECVAAETGKSCSALEALITFVRDRPGHDRRYAIDFSKLQHELAWSPRRDLASGLRETVRFYLGHRDWLERVRTGAYRDWLRENYERR